RGFLRKVLAYYAEFAAARADDPEGLESQADGCFRVGLIRFRLGESKDAEAAYRDALAIMQRLADDFPDRAHSRHAPATTYCNLGVVLDHIGRYKDSEEAQRAALRLKKQLVAEFSERAEYRLELAASYSNLGAVLIDTGRLKEAEEAQREGLA